VTSLARVNLGEILFRKGDHRGAIRELEAVMRADPLNQRAALWLARAYAAAHREDDAIRVYDRLMQAAASGAPLDPVVVLAATDLDLGRQRIQPAIERLSRVPASVAKTPEILTARAAVADAQGSAEEAERLFRAALAAQPASIDALSRLVDLQLRRGRAADAWRLAAESTKRFPDSAERNALAGEAALAGRRYADAAQSFGAALALAPDSASVRTDLARAQLLQNDADAALRTIEPVATRDAEMLRGAALSQKGDWRRAADAYQRAVTLGTPTIELLNALGNAQLEAGRAQAAAETLEKSLAMKSDQPAIRALLQRARERSTRR
jgi:tetratricopeptide (TPR) repeat protein